MLAEPKYFESLYPGTARDKEIDTLVSYIQEGSSCQVIGVPGVGRANLLGLLAYNKRVRLRHFPKHHADVHFVMTNFSEVRNRPLLDVMKFLFLSLLTSLRERNRMEDYAVIDHLFKDALSYNDELVLTQGLKNAVDYLAVEKKLTLIFLFDRFDEYVPMVTSEFFTNLRALRDRAKYRFSVVFSLARPLEETIEPQLFSDFSDFLAGHWLYLPLFDKPSVMFRIGYLEKLTGKKLPEKIKEAMLAATGGHIRLVKLAVEAVLSQSVILSEAKNLDANEKILKQVQDDKFVQFLLQQPTIQRALMGIWKSLTPSEQLLLQTHTSSFTEETYLSHAGLLTRQGVQPPLLAAFIKQVRPQENAKIIYDVQTSAIKQGEVTLSDTLTKAEFRLLRYLLQHQNQIVNREDIVQAVWQDSQTTVGVTEQAVDQLIFRLRRKIEKDPNSPDHLQTVKGRGVRFIA